MRYGLWVDVGTGTFYGGGAGNFTGHFIKQFSSEDFR